MTTYVSRLGSAIPFAGINTGAYAVKISGTQYLCIAGTLKIDLSVGRRSQASFQLYTTTGTHFNQYQPVTIFDQNGTLVFNGFVSTVKEQKPGFQKSLVHTVTCTDMHFLADKRIIAKAYTGMTIGAMVQDIVKNYLAEEGVALSAIFDGLIPGTKVYPGTNVYPNGNVGVVPSVNFSYCTVSAALDQLVTTASSAGIPYYWQIDQNKKLWFQPYTAVTNSTVVDGTWIDNKSNFAYVQRQNPKYRNIEYLTGGVNQTSQQSVKLQGDGSTTSWTLGYPLFSAPTISVIADVGFSQIQQTVGVKGSDKTGPSSQYYWQYGDPVITQDNNVPVLTSDETLYVQYVGIYPSVIQVQNTAQISAQAAIDGTSGKIEAVDTDQAVVDVHTGFIEASRLLIRYGVSGTQLQFTTMLNGNYQPGQLIQVNLPDHAINNQQMLIETVNIADTDNQNIWYTVTAVLGPYDTTWVSFFSKLLVETQPVSAITVGTTTTIAPTTFTPTQTTANFVSGTPMPKAFLTALTNASNTAASFSATLPKPVANLTPKTGLPTPNTLASFSASKLALTASFTGTAAASSGGGGNPGGGPTGSPQPPSGKMYVYQFGNDSNDSTNVNNQYLSGTNLLLYWSEIETSEGVYDWAHVESLIKPWADAGKKVILRFSTAGHYGWHPPYSHSGTPAWVFSLGVPKVVETDQSTYPKYWDTTFLSKLQAFITAMGQKYDGDSRIEYVQISTGDGGEGKVDTHAKDKTTTPAVLALWQASAIGYTDAVWRDCTFKIISFYTSAFKKTPLCWMGDNTFIGGTGKPFDEGDMVLWCTGQSNGLGTSPFTPSGNLPRLWLQNNGIGTNSAPDPKWLLTTIGCEQLAKTATTGDTLDGDMAAMLKFGAKYALIFYGDISNSSYQSTLAKYYYIHS